MQTNSFFIKNKKEILILVGIVAIFILLRLPAIHHPLHQDEYKWPIIVNPALTEPGGIPHPPLSEFIYKTAGKLIGYDNFRLVPFFFGFFNLLLIYFVVRRRYSAKAAQWASLFFAFSYYSVLASLMVDTDGQILPFFFLLALLFYDLFNSSSDRKKFVWLALFFASVVCGMLVKMSFILPLGVFVLDFLIEKNIFKDWRRLAKFLVGGIIGLLALAAILYFSRLIFPFFNLEFALKYWEGFAKGFGGRNFFQTGIQFIKAIFYLSPLLIFGGLLSLRSYRRDLKLFHIFIGSGLLFYLVIFDFSQGALDRYFQFLIVPLCVITGVVFSTLSFTPLFAKERSWKRAFLLSMIVVLIFLTQFISQYVPPLYPKTEWISRFLSLEWNFLFPFTGGSGPLGFYISFLFIAASFIYGAILSIGAYAKKNMKNYFLAAFLFVGFIYNLSFTEEYIFGKINGSARNLLSEAVFFIQNSPEIKKITVYNDNGGYDVMNTGKYRKRLYTSPAFNANEKIATLNQYKEHYLEINIPRIDPQSFYREYFDSCKTIYKQTDRYISASLHDCRNAPDLKLK